MIQHDGQNPERELHDTGTLLRELDEARKTIRTLLRQMQKTQDQLTETQRAYTKTVANMVEIARENTTLSRECEMWKARAQSAQAHTPTIALDGMPIELSLEETQAIRRAMARLHHPDAGGNVERMKAWNATLDQLESRHK
jgi:chromosome segregation ATPase